MEGEGPRLLRLEEDAGPVRPSKNPVDLVSECIMRKGGWGGRARVTVYGDQGEAAVRVRFVIYVH